MFPTKTELLEKIRLGEDSFLELKEARFSGARVSAPERSDLADELAALANSRGGVLVLGVQDKTHEILGIPRERLDAVESLAREACNDSLRPSLAPIIERLELPNSAGETVALIRIDVPRSLFVHQSPGGYFHRVGSSKRQMPPEYLARLFQPRSQTRLIRFDEQTVPNASLDDLDDALWERFATPRTQDPKDSLLQKLGMAQPDEDATLRPTVAGALLAARSPQRFLPNAYIQAVSYRGTTIRAEGDSLYQRDARDIQGTLDRQIFDACDFVQKNMFVAARKQGMGREDLPQYDMLAVFEAVVNAVAHRDYSVYGAKIRLRMFDDRLELYSPGAIPNTMTIDSLPYRQFSRNETITSLLARCPMQNTPETQAHRAHIMDKRGEGVPLILSRSEALSGRKPFYRLIDDSELVLTIYAAVPDAPEK